MNTIDLHMHTHVSDGVFSPAELVQQAHKLGLKIISITDHDEIDAIRPAQEAARQLGMEVISGTELSVTWNNQSMEILGYHFRTDGRELLALLAEKKRGRINRARAIVEKLAELGMPLLWDKVQEIGGPGSIGRPHIAQAMVEAGYVQNVKEAFDKYLGTDKPANVGSERQFSLEEGISAIHEAGGVAVIAHPILPGVDDYLDLDKILPDAIRAGIDGIEAYYTGYTEDITRMIEEKAFRHNLIVTGGSDYHGGNVNPHLRLGEVAVPEKCVEMIRQRAAWIRQQASAR